MNRLKYLLDLQTHCESKGQKLSRKKLDELNDLLKNVVVLQNTLENGKEKQLY